jgi:hypothetical protein
MTHQSLSSSQSQTAQGNSRHTPVATKHIRRAVRYALETEVVFGWSDNDGLSRESRGFTRDISPRGAYVIATHCPPLGASVAMSFYLPILTGGSQTVQVQAQSRVLRVDSRGAGGCSGFSV